MVLSIAALALVLVVLAGKVFGVFDQFSLTSPSSAVPGGGATGVAQVSNTPPTLVCPQGSTARTVGAEAGAGVGGLGEDTPLAATATWLATVAGHDELSEVRQFAAPGGSLAQARVVAWYDRDGQLRAEATVTQNGVGGWVLRTASSCP